MKTKWNLIKDLYSYLCLIACAGCCCFAFIQILIGGCFWAEEPNLAILIIEIAVSGAIFGLGIERLVNFIKVNKVK